MLTKNMIAAKVYTLLYTLPMPLTLSSPDFALIEPFLPKGLGRSRSPCGPLERAAGHMMRMVLNQELRPGEKIPIDEIAERAGVSRTPIREALRLLETDGLVRAIPNRGFVIQRLDRAQTQHLYDARRCIEGDVAEAAHARRDDRFLQDLRKLHQVYAQVLGSDIDRRRIGMLIDKAFHVRIAEQAGNPYLCQLLGNIFDRLILTRPIEGFPINRSEVAVQEHVRIVDAFAGADAQAASEAVKANIANGSAAIVAHMITTLDFA